MNKQKVWGVCSLPSYFWCGYCRMAKILLCPSYVRYLRRKSWRTQTSHKSHNEQRTTNNTLKKKMVNKAVKWKSGQLHESTIQQQHQTLVLCWSVLLKVRDSGSLLSSLSLKLAIRYSMQPETWQMIPWIVLPITSINLQHTHGSFCINLIHEEIPYVCLWRYFR